MAVLPQHHPTLPPPALQLDVPAASSPTTGICLITTALPPDMQAALCTYLEPQDRARLPYVSRSIFEVYGQPRYNEIETLTIYWNHDDTGTSDDSLRIFRDRCPHLSTLTIKRHEASRALAKAILSGTCGQQITALHLPAYRLPFQYGSGNFGDCGGFNQASLMEAGSVGSVQTYPATVSKQYNLLISALAAGGLPHLTTLSFPFPLPLSLSPPCTVMHYHTDAVANMLNVRQAWGCVGLTHFPSLHHLLLHHHDLPHNADQTSPILRQYSPRNLPFLLHNHAESLLTWLQAQHSALALEKLSLLNYKEYDSSAKAEPAFMKQPENGALLLARVFEAFFDGKFPKLTALDIRHGEPLDDESFGFLTRTLAERRSGSLRALSFGPFTFPQDERSLSRLLAALHDGGGGTYLQSLRLYACHLSRPPPHALCFTI